jgi:hypothetical protein
MSAPVRFLILRSLQRLASTAFRLAVLKHLQLIDLSQVSSARQSSAGSSTALSSYLSFKPVYDMVGPAMHIPLPTEQPETSIHARVHKQLSIHALNDRLLAT